MKKQKKIGILFLTLFLSFFFVVPSSRVSADTDYSTIRVKISISSSSVTVVLNGDYKISESSTSLAKGTYTLSVANTNKVRIKGDGIDKVVGTSLTLVNQSESTMTVKGTDYGSISYLGDMKFTVDSAKLMVVNYVPLEQYLYGVVGHEMSNSFPVEALKAQAVCARGYAIKMISSSGSYDIGDTPSHQVYKGYNSSYTNVIKAVDETKGQVLTYDGKIISTYYSASNGGQTELPGNTWGGGSAKNAAYPYLKQKDDPYDLRNTSSLYQKIFVPKQVENSEYELISTLPGDYAVQVVNVNEFCYVRSGPSTSYSVLGTADLGTIYQYVSTEGDWYKIIYNGKTAYVKNTVSQKIQNGQYLYENPVLNDLQNRAFNELKSSGISIDKATDVRLITVNSLSNGQKRWPSTDSSSYVTANANVTVKYCTSGTSTLSSDKSLNLVLQLMEPADGGGYYLSHPYLNSNLRLRGVSSASGGYYVTNGRYGHGVGMSQRGAQQMAKEGKTYNDILSFYFDGTTLTTLDTEVDDVMYGDVNGDSKISLIDLLLVQRHLVKITNLSGASLKAADVSKDGNVSLVDLIMIQRHLLGMMTIIQ